MKKYLLLILSFLLTFSLCSCSSVSYKDDIEKTVDGYLSIYKNGDNLDKVQAYCTDNYVDDLSVIDDELLNDENLGDVFNKEAKDFVRVCGMNFIKDYTVHNIEVSNQEAIVDVTIQGIKFSEFSLDSYEDEIMDAKETYINENMDEYETIYKTDGEQAAYQKLYDDSSKAVFDKMKDIVSSLHKDTYDVSAIVICQDGAWKIDELIVE